ncbi:hypothetical protein [Alicyclobacillus vulcanalis]|uniref:Uncharacterized protein n=1 Tax=Alicyclobacillus vulcanalis TaxID=252246 RepID=A0A1N7MGN2_9BACL|nr:hypothetical protein [Alicyclobacillus vulcanalis]SIS85306.1 hypothetical protein SAMN05421799_105139 [Alicyclobacillus vulcanalis]
MPRVILGGEEPRAHHRLQHQVQQSAPRALNALTRLDGRRSQAYVEAMSQLDMGPGVRHEELVDSLIQKIQAELPDVELAHLPLGIVAKCYLGAPYEVHTLDRVGRIIQHYKTFEPLPDSLEAARTLALHPQYAFVEVYTDVMRAVLKTGDVAVVKR